MRREITEAFDLPLVGEKQDRVPRIGSYVKRFKPISLGEMRLSAGRGELTLSAAEIPGDEAVNVRYIRLELLEGE